MNPSPERKTLNNVRQTWRLIFSPQSSQTFYFLLDGGVRVEIFARIALPLLSAVSLRLLSSESPNYDSRTPARRHRRGLLNNSAALYFYLNATLQTDK